MPTTTTTKRCIKCRAEILEPVLADDELDERCDECGD